jgi:hypothetical protein
MRSPVRARHKGGPPVRRMRSVLPAHGTRPAAAASGALWSAAPDGAAHGLPPIVSTFDWALTAPSELPPAGRRCALKPPYPRHHPCYIPLNERVRERNSVRTGISQDPERPFDHGVRPWRRQVQSGGRREPSSDTPVVMAPGVLSGLPGQEACMPQAASNLSPHQPSLAPVGVSYSGPVQPRSATAELSPAMPVVGMPPQAFQSMIRVFQAPPSAPRWRGSLLFQAAAPAMRSDAMAYESPKTAGIVSDCWITASTRQSRGIMSAG